MTMSEPQRYPLNLRLINVVGVILISVQKMGLTVEHNVCSFNI